MAARSLPVAERLIARIDFRSPNGCWLWTGRVNDSGYGEVRGEDWRDRHARVHCLIYRLLVGEVPAGLELDHTCRVRACCNPAHLEPVTHAENIRRSPIAPPALNARKTHCKHGHRFDDANTYITAGGGRACRACGREHARRKYQERVA